MRKLAIQFKDGYLAQYPQSTEDDYKSLCSAGSPGQWLHSYPHYSNYHNGIIGIIIEETSLSSSWLTIAYLIEDTPTSITHIDQLNT